MSCDLTGTWTTKIEGFKVTLSVTQSGSNLSGTITVGGFPNKHGSFTGTVSGDSVNISGDYDDHPFTFDGTVAGDCNSITGTIHAKVAGQPINKQVTFTRQ